MIIECVICYESLQTSEVISHTICGHVFHYPCLSRWLNTSLTCPECRERVSKKKVGRLYLHFGDTNSEVDTVSIANLQSQISRLDHDVQIKEFEIVSITENNARLVQSLESKTNEIVGLQVEIQIAREENRSWKDLNEKQRAEMENMNNNIRSLTKYRNQLLSSSQYWDQISQIFDGITDKNTLVGMISDTNSELIRLINAQRESQRTITRLTNELNEISEARTLLVSMRERQREMESNLACSEIIKVNLRRRMEMLENILEEIMGRDQFLRTMMYQENSMTGEDNSFSLKKRKFETTVVIDEIAEDPAESIEVVDLEAQQNDSVDPSSTSLER